MKKRIYISAFVFLLLPGIASAVNLDSLWAALKDSNQPDTTKAILLIKIGKEYRKGKPELAISKFEQALSYARKAGSEKWEHNSLKEMASVLTHTATDYLNNGKSEKALEYYNRSLNNKKEMGDAIGVVGNYHNIGWVYELTGQYDMAINSYTKGLNVLNEEGFKKETPMLLSAIGNINRRKGYHQEALDYYSRSLKIKEKIGDKKGIAVSLHNIGVIYNEQGDYTKAIDYHTRSLKIQEEIGDKKGIAYSLNNIGAIYKIQGDLAKAIDYFTKSLKIKEELGDKKGIAVSLNNIGVIYNKQGDYAKAIDYYTRSLKIQEEIGDKKGIAVSLNNIGVIYKYQGDYTKAIDYHTRSLKIRKEIGSKLHIDDASYLLYSVYEKTNHPAKALEMYELSNQMRDSLESSEVTKAVAQNEQKLAHQSQVIVMEKEQARKAALEAAETRSRKLKTYSVAGVSLLSLLFGLFILQRFLHTRRQQRTIAAQKKVVEDQTKEITDSIRYAESIQRAILPSDEDLAMLPEHFVLFNPKDIVSGDFYWMAEKEGRVYFAACDCTGHGVPGAFMSMLNSALLTEAVNEKGLTRPCDIFYEVRKGIIDALKQTGELDSQKDGMDAVLCAWNGNGTLEYALANNPLILIRNGELSETKPDKMPVSILTGEQIPYTHHELKVEKGDRVYIFSDGYPDQFGGKKGRKFMIKRFKQLLLDIHQEPLEAQRDKLDAAMQKWMGDGEQVDDILVIGVRF
ncbi:MAG TPA: tetratricopeptide repeat protein [Flavobacteriales bacterium]|nr:tetratricopeptide repeat protein [Flavobacteriales bacterium]